MPAVKQKATSLSGTSPKAPTTRESRLRAISSKTLFSLPAKEGALQPFMRHSTGLPWSSSASWQSQP